MFNQEAVVSIHRLYSSSPDNYESLYPTRSANATSPGSLSPVAASNRLPASTGGFSNLVDQATPAQPRLVKMVMTSLTASMGQPGTAPTADTSSPVDPTQALSGFMKNLMTALRSQTEANALPVATKSPTAALPLDQDPASISTYHPGLQKLDSSSQIGTALQNLVTQLSGMAGPTPPASSPVGTLQQSYAGLVSSLGGNPQNASLNQFLSNFEQQLQSMGPTGNLVNVTA